MQEFSSTVSYSPSFSFYASGEFAAAAVKVSREIQSYNTVKSDSVNDDEQEDAASYDFEFETSPLHENTFVHFPAFPPKSNDVVSLSYKKNDDVASPGGGGGGWRSTPPSPLWSESEDFESLTGSCLWSPLRSPAVSEIGKASESSRTSKRCRLRKLLTRSNSDGGADSSSSPSESKRCFLKELMRRSHSDGSKTTTSSPSVKGKDKTPSFKIGEGGDKRRKSYLPYRQDLIGVFAGMRKLRH